MRFLLLTLGTTGTVIALGLTGIAMAAPAGNAPAVTHWDIAQENLVREFSQGLGADIPGASFVMVSAKAESATSGTSAERHALRRDDRQRERAHEQRTKKTKHSH